MFVYILRHFIRFSSKTELRQDFSNQLVDVGQSTNILQKEIN